MATNSQPTVDCSTAGILICIPVFNDWESATLLIGRLDDVATRLDLPVSVLLIDDGSSQPCDCRLPHTFAALRSVEVLQLRRNLGHQRAIALGLAFVHAKHPCQYVVVMDADGEDVPDDIPAMLDHCRQAGSQKIVFAKRAKRSEGWLFCAGYAAYRIVHFMLTGRKVEVGNFSVIPFPMLERLVAISELWNHYAAAVVHSRMPTDMIPLARGRRLAGRSKMNLVSLITHGMSAISVYCDIVGTRLLCFTTLLIVLALGGLLATVGVRLFTNLAIPGWATMAAGILTVVLLNLFTLIIIFVLFVLQSRSMTGFLPIRDWQFFVARHWSVASERLRSGR
jgi:polyisoprenyl-phosphate glycosyltransferase